MQNDSTTPKPERTWTYPWETWEGVFWSLSYLVMVAFGYYTPLDVLDKYPEAKAFTDFMASWNLQIQRVGEISGYANQANRFVYSVLWCTAPVYMGSFVYRTCKILKPKNFVKELKTQWEFWMLGVLGSIAWTWGSFSLPYEASNSRIGMVLFMTPLSKAVYAPLFIFLTSLVMIHFFYLIWAFSTNRIVITGTKNGR